MPHFIFQLICRHEIFGCRECLISNLVCFVFVLGVVHSVAHYNSTGKSCRWRCHLLVVDVGVVISSLSSKSSLSSRRHCHRCNCLRKTSSSLSLSSLLLLSTSLSSKSSSSFRRHQHRHRSHCHLVIIVTVVVVFSSAIFFRCSQIPPIISPILSPARHSVAVPYYINYVNSFSNVSAYKKCYSYAWRLGYDA